MPRQKKPPDYFTSGPHEFVEPEQPIFGMFVGGARSAGAPGALGGILTAGPRGRLRCAMPGCNKVRGDPIHWAAETGSR